MLDALIDVHYPEAQLHAVGLQEKLNALFEFVDSADYAPARQASQVLDELRAGRIQASTSISKSAASAFSLVLWSGRAGVASDATSSRPSRVCSTMPRDTHGS